MAFFLETLFGGLMVGMLYALIALGFVLIFKASGVFNFAMGAMVLFAALAMARFSEWIPKWLGIAPGETSSDGRFTLLPNVCLGDCDHAPVMMIDEEHHHDLDPAKVDAILQRYANESVPADAGNRPTSE